MKDDNELTVEVYEYTEAVFYPKPGGGWHGWWRRWVKAPPDTSQEDESNPPGEAET